MNKQELFNQIKKKKSYLCIGLDTDQEKLPAHLKNREDSVLQFNKAIINHTHQTCVAYKINTAFYEAQGIKGWKFLQDTAEYIKANYPEIFLIADAKRGDIGNTSKMYAKAFFEKMPFDAVTVAPYMGKDSITPFLEFKDKWVIVLGVTSNQGAFDFQFLQSKMQHKAFYEHVIETASSWGDAENMMFVVGATKEEQIAEIRQKIPGHFLLVPGIGAQGGSLEKVSSQGMNASCGLLINSSRSIIFSDSSERFAESAKNQAETLQQEMELQLAQHNIL